MTDDTSPRELNMGMYEWRTSAALKEDEELLARYRDFVNARAELMLYMNESGRDPEFIGVVLAFANEHAGLIAAGQEEML